MRIDVVLDQNGDSVQQTTHLPRLAFLIKGTVEELKGAITWVGLFARIWEGAAKIVNTAVTFVVVTFVEAFRTIVRAAATVASISAAV